MGPAAGVTCVCGIAVGHSAAAGGFSLQTEQQHSMRVPCATRHPPMGAASGRCRSKMRSSFSAPPVHSCQAESPRANDTVRTMCLCCGRAGGVRRECFEEWRSFMWVKVQACCPASCWC